MAGFNPFQIFNIISPRMVARGVLYPYRRAARIVRSTQPDLREPAYWRAIWLQTYNSKEHKWIRGYSMEA